MRRILATVILTLTSLVLALCMAEGVARVMHSRTRAAQYGCNRLPDGTPLAERAWASRFLVPWPLPGVRHGFAPMARWKFCYPAGRQPYLDSGGCVSYATGPHGYRGPEGLWHKPEGRCRILIIGDSVSFGIGVPTDSLYSRHLERRLRRNRPNLDVVNMGVIGYLASEGVVVLVQQGLRRSPDLVVWQLHINDLIAMEGWGPQPMRLGLPDSWRKSLRLIWLIEHRLALTRHTREMNGKYGEKADPVITDQRTEDFVRAANWAGKVLFNNALSCVAVLYPYPDFLGGRYPFMGLHRIFETECRKAGIIPVDLLPHLRRLSQDKLWVDASDNHPSAQGHRIMADVLYQVIADHFGPGLERLQPR
ncbi:SGNH/GDSL hydrolase family protein [Candidatus Fermentibacteria bacterium]|nr:SGNH/GDSL hydrolase family protein [Candidatus Fermentibacteria bacterium]